MKRGTGDRESAKEGNYHGKSKESALAVALMPLRAAAAEDSAFAIETIQEF